MVARSSYNVKMSDAEYMARMQNAACTVQNTMGWLNLGTNFAFGILGTILNGSHKVNEGDEPGGTDSKTYIRERLAELGVKNKSDLDKLTGTANIFKLAEARDLLDEVGSLNGTGIDSNIKYDISQELQDRKAFNKALQAYNSNKTLENGLALEKAYQNVDSKDMKKAYETNLKAEIDQLKKQKQAS